MPPLQSSQSFPFQIKSPVKGNLQFLFLFVESSEISELMLAKTHYFYIPIEILVGNANGFTNFMKSLLTNLIPTKI